MPYISQEHKDILDAQFNNDCEMYFGDILDSIYLSIAQVPENKRKGFLNYIVSRIALTVLKANGLSYQNISESISALNDAAEEIRRRLLNNYENKAIVKNGDLLEYEELIKEIL